MWPSLMKHWRRCAARWRSRRRGLAHLALQGSLAWLRAGQEPDEAQHAKLVRLANDSREQAVQGNPLLKQ